MRNLHQNCLSNGSNGHTKQDLVVQHDQLHKQVQALPVSCHLHPPLQLWNMDPACWLKKKGSRLSKTKCLRQLLCISYLEHKTNNSMRSTINCHVGPQESLPVTVKRRKLAWFRQVTRLDSLSKTILQGSLEGGRLLWSAEEMLDGQHQRKTSLLMPELHKRASCRKGRKRIFAELSLMSPPPPQRPNRSMELNRMEHACKQPVINIWTDTWATTHNHVIKWY